MLPLCPGAGWELQSGTFQPAVPEYGIPLWQVNLQKNPCPLLPKRKRALFFLFVYCMRPSESTCPIGGPEKDVSFIFKLDSQRKSSPAGLHSRRFFSAPTSLTLPMARALASACCRTLDNCNQLSRAEIHTSRSMQAALGDCEGGSPCHPKPISSQVKDAPTTTTNSGSSSSVNSLGLVPFPLGVSISPDVKQVSPTTATGLAFGMTHGSKIAARFWEG